MMPDRLKKVLLKHREEQKERFKNSIKMNKKKRKWSEDEFVFLSRTFRGYTSSSLPKGLREIREKYSLEYTSPYGLRHSYASYCADRKMDPVVLSRSMGHSSVQTTNSVYIHVTDKRKKLEMQRVFENRNG